MVRLEGSKMEALVLMALGGFGLAQVVALVGVAMMVAKGEVL